MNPSVKPSFTARDFSPRTLIHLLLVAGLGGITYATLTHQFALALAVMAMPVGLFMVGYALVHPRFCYFLYATWAFFFIALMRYTQKDGFSVILDALLVFSTISVLLAIYWKKNSEFRFANVANALTFSYLIWAVFTLLQMLNPNIHSIGVEFGFRHWIFGPIALCCIASIVSNTPRMLKGALITGGIFVTLIFIKLMWQRFVGFDQAEKISLYVHGMAKTHIISSGIRYFSLLSDAANFGTVMGIMSLIYGIVAFNTRGRWLTIFYLAVSAMSTVGLLLSGTRGAIVIPLVGLVLFCLLCRNIRVFAITTIFGIALFIFLAFTHIGDGNQFIRRARTVLHATEDASFNVRIENRKEIAEYLDSRPFGVGIAETIPKLWVKGDKYTEGTIPSDSHMVGIWIQTGLPGLVLYLLTNAFVILTGCYIVFFKVRHKQLRMALAAFTCATFGTIVCGYVAYSPGQPPTNFLLIAMMAFVMNGGELDSKWTTSQIINKNQTNKKQTAL